MIYFRRMEPPPYYLRFVTTSNVEKIMTDRNEIFGVCNSNLTTNPLIINGENVNYGTIKHIEFGRSWDLESIPYEFGLGYTNLESIGPLPNSVKLIEDYFLYQCPRFNSEIVFPENLQQIASWFLGYCASFNHDLILPDNCLYLSPRFLFGCTSFNSSIELKNIVSIDHHFMDGCISYNKPIILPEDIFIGSNFMTGCVSFDSPITLPSIPTDFRSQGFLYGCSSFNQPITIPPTLNFIFQEFMMGCSEYSQPLYFNAILNAGYIRNYFMENCDNFTQLYAADPDNFIAALATSVDGRGTNLATENPNSYAYQHGIDLIGFTTAQKQAFKTKYPDLNGVVFTTTGKTYYRKINS